MFKIVFIAIIASHAITGTLKQRFLLKTDCVASGQKLEPEARAYIESSFPGWSYTLRWACKKDMRLP